MRNHFLPLIVLFFLNALHLRSELKFEKTTLFVAAPEAAKSLSGDFKFTNLGDQPVEILKTTTSCGCTIAMPSKKNFNPGETGVISVIFTVGDRAGHQKKVIVVETNESSANLHPLTFETEIIQPLSVAPHAVSWKQYAPIEFKPISIKYRSRGSVKFVGANILYGPFQVQTQSAPDPVMSKLQVVPLSTTKSSQGRLRLQFETNSGDKIERFVVLTILPEAAP